MLIGAYTRNSSGLLSEMAKEAGFDYVENAVGGNDGRHVHVSVTPDLCIVDVDLIFVLDASDSISDANWAKTKEFVKRTVSFFNINSPDTNSRIGAIAFSTYMNLDDAFNMSQYTTEEEMGCAIEAIGRNPAYTYPGKALEYVRTHMLTTEAGMHDVEPSTITSPSIRIVYAYRPKSNDDRVGEHSWSTSAGTGRCRHGGGRWRRPAL